VNDDAILALAERLIPSVKEAGQFIMDVYRRHPSAHMKADGSPVTEADCGAEDIILPALEAAAPAIQIISEENAQSHDLPPASQFFLVDPLDGTKEFLRPGGQGAFTVNIGLIVDRQPVMGVIYAPALGRLFYGSRNRGAFEIVSGQAQPIAVRDIVADDMVAVTSASHRDPETDAWLCQNKVTKTVAIGSSLKFCLIAAGEADAYPRYGPTMEWDTAAGDAILRAAGGRVMDAAGAPYLYGKTGYLNTPFFAFGSV
jgi:3'(2'), 5'-bisphosphate nucleotidase